MPDLPEILAAYAGHGYVLAPAGYGKTYLVAAAVCHAERRQLVLTHTYAGVNALRRKMRQLKVPDGACRVDTIASWALRLSLSYPEASGWTTERPDGEQWTQMYAACARLLDCPFIRRIVRASYGGLYVDEYQDCSAPQHAIVLKLARDLPCRILGDPLQGIFDFNEDPIDWPRDVAAQFEPLGRLGTPHRWKRAGAPELGRWLHEVREALEARQSVDMAQRRTAGLTPRLTADGEEALRQAQVNTCHGFRCGRAETVIAIHKGDPVHKARGHRLAKQLRGGFVSIEEIEGNDLFAFVTKLEQARTNGAGLKAGIRLVRAALTTVGESLPAGTARGEPMLIRDNTRNPDVARAGNAYLADPTSANMASFLLALKAAPDVHTARADLFNRALGVLRKHALNPHLTLSEVAEKYQTQFRYRGRPVGCRRLIGTTLLVKGLEFHHAIVLDAQSLSRKELYVALTRGAKSLTIISSTATLNPPD